MAIGTSGMGWIIGTPSIANDSPSLFYTNASAGPTNYVNPFSANNTLNTGCIAAYHNGPYAGSVFSLSGTQNDLKANARVVSIGIRLTFTGPVTTMQGSYTVYSAPQHRNCSGFNAAKILTDPTGLYKPITREPFEIVMGPTADATEVAQGLEVTPVVDGVSDNLLYPWSTTSLWYTDTTVANYHTYNVSYGTAGNPVWLIVVNGHAGDLVHVDYIQHMEAWGESMAASVTENDEDISGASAVLSALAGIALRKPATPDRDNYSLLYEGLASTAAALAPMVLPSSATSLAKMLA